MLKLWTRALTLAALSLALTAPAFALADDGGPDGAASSTDASEDVTGATDGASEDASHDAAGSDTGPHDSGASTSDGGPVRECVALNAPCSVGGVACCQSNAYCGAFAGAGAANVCGVDSTNKTSSSSCALGSGPGTGAGGVGSASLVAFVAFGLVLRVKREAVRRA